MAKDFGCQSNQQKRIGHCQKAVHSSVNSHETVKKLGKTRVVYSKELRNGCSYNWRADWAKLIGKTYAQVVKAKYDLGGQIQTQRQQAVGKKQLKPTVLAKKHNVIPVSRPITETVENTKHVKCKKVTTGVRTVSKVLKPCDGFHCQTKNRFELLPPVVESLANSDNIVRDNLSESSKTRKQANAHSTVNNGY